jgi:hypothetical protein
VLLNLAVLITVAVITFLISLKLLRKRFEQ